MTGNNRQAHCVIAAVIAAVCSLTVLAGCRSDEPTAGMNRDEVVEAYVQALQEGDRGRLSRLNDPNLDGADAIDQKITAIGNRRWTNLHITWVNNPVTDQPAGAQLSATDDAGRQITDYVIVSSVNGYWHLALGDGDTPTDDPRLSSPSPDRS